MTLTSHVERIRRHRYGYVTNTSVKFVAIMQDAPVRESELRTVRMCA